MKEQTISSEESYVVKLDIGLATVKRFKRLVELCAPIPRIVICGIGVSGVGKSHAVKQVGAERGVPFPDHDDVEDLTRPSQVLHVPQMQVEDFYIPTIPKDAKDKRYYDRRIPRRFQAVIEYTAENEKMIRAGHKGRPIILVEEPNRARDKSVTAALFTLLEDRMIGDTPISSLVQMVCLMNPSTAGNSVNQFEKDNASRRRLLPIGVTSSFGEFVDYINTKKFHPAIVDYIQAQPSMVYDHAAAAAGHVFACPASWETVSEILKRMDELQLPLICTDARIAIAGKIGMTATAALLDFIENRATVVAPLDVLNHYKKVRHIVQGYIDPRGAGKPRHDLIATLCHGVAATLFHQAEDPKKYRETLPQFMDDLLPDMLVAFVTVHVAGEAKATDDGMTYWKRLGMSFADVPAYNSAMKKLFDAQAKIQTEKDKEKDE